MGAYFNKVAKALFFHIATPAAVATIALGMALIAYGPTGAWLVMKLVVVTVAVLLHLYMGVMLYELGQGRDRHGAGFYRVFGWLPWMLLLVIAALTGAKPRIVYTREEPRLSELQLDMGVRVPLANVALDKPVNGQHPYASWILDLPVRGSDGRLGFAPALLQRNADSAAEYLPLTRANLIHQSFKFLGERYGWGHAYNGRDCSGFVSEVYRSMGVELPRNTSDQSVSPAFDRVHFAADATRETRMAAVDALDVGDLIYIPGHVMMFAGRIDGMPWVIHDTNGGSFLDADGTLRAMQLNGVSLTPLVPLRFGKDHDYIDRITNIVRMTHTP